MGLIAYLCLGNKIPTTFSTLPLSDTAFGTQNYERAVRITSRWLTIGKGVLLVNFNYINRCNYY